MVLRPGPPPPPRPDFSKPISTEGPVSKVKENDSTGQDLQVTGVGGKLPPFAVGPVTAQRRPIASGGQPNTDGRAPLTSPVTRAPATMLSPFTPPPFYTVKGSWERSPSASMRKQHLNDGTRRLMHSAPLPHNSGGQLLEDLAGAVPEKFEGKQWYSELHKLRAKFDPRWHAGTRQDPKLKGNWTEVNISDPVQPTADMPSIPGAATGDTQARHGFTRRAPQRANPNCISNWDNGQLQAVLRERAAEAAAAPRPPDKMDPTLQALMVVDQEPSLTYRGYKRTEGRLQSRLITAEYMREFYRKRDKTGQKKRREAPEVGMLEFEELGGDQLQQQWAQARIETLFRRAEEAWDEKYGAEMMERAEQWRAYEERASPREEAVTPQPGRQSTDRARSQKTLVQMMSRKDAAGVQATPADLRKVREMMYSSVNSNAKDLSAPEYLYYEDPSFGAFDTLVGEDSVTFTGFSDPVEEETAKSRLERVVLRNRAIAMSAGPAAVEVSDFVGAQTGLGRRDTRQLVRERIQKEVVPQMDPNVMKRYEGRQVELGGDLPVHSAHLSKGKTYMRRVKDYDDIFPVSNESQTDSPRRN